MNPKVFLSHASEDKERFVLDFARKLRESGVDVWLDRWEMLPGDSLVEKIFDEGLKEASAVIIVLSINSVNKAWVKEELNASIIKKINKGSKIIPVVLDNCIVPESLKSTLWEKIIDINNYQESFDRIIASIFGQYDKPTLGSKPSYMTEKILDIPGLNKIDNLILKVSCECVLDKKCSIIEPNTLFGLNSPISIPQEELSDSILILEQNGFVKLYRHMGPGPYRYEITIHGMNEYAKSYIPNYDEIINDIIVAIINMDLKNNNEISIEVNQPIPLVNHVLKLLNNNNHIKIVIAMGGHIRIISVSPSLKRILNNDF
ncbi:MAG: toll/interleukin-1 receptor domain-containing protein [Candidatus Marinimicrobia bacterium]|nr:toll/interleukin-1 receptor domain-containing protein [Candidatus Neomarinimicrobiota bacterium]